MTAPTTAPKQQQPSAIRLDWSLTPEAIQKQADDIIARSKAVQDAVAKLPASERTFTTVIVPLARAEGWESTLSASCYFPYASCHHIFICAGSM